MPFMADNVRELRPRISDTEKITVNLGYVDLDHVDLMVQEGFYSNRTDFIRTAIRNQLERHADVVKQSTVRKSLDLGLRNYSREDLEAARRAGQMLHINVLGLATIAQDVSPSWPAPPLRRFRCSGPSTQLPRSRPLSPTEQGECDAESEHSFRGHAPHACGPTSRGHRPPAAHAPGRQRP
jgi:Arc/MetJ-type ribon-helix-helix transcriptional regulator